MIPGFRFAFPLAWWLVPLVAAAIAALAYFSYRKPIVPLTRTARAVLTALRALALAAIVFVLCRPVIEVEPPADEIVVPILLDVSRSMRVADAGGQTRIARALQIFEDELVPSLAARFRLELYSVGDALLPAKADELTASARQSDLTGAIASIRGRYRGRGIPGIVVISDGGDTGREEPKQAANSDEPSVFAIGVGSPGGLPDRELWSITAGDPRLDQASVDLHVSSVSRGYGTAPYEIRLLANGRLIDTRKVTPAAEGSPVEEVFTVSPDPTTPTVYAASIVGAGEETVSENNARSIVVNPPGRPRLVLALLGAPGFDHSFLGRIWARDPGLEIDTVLRKGRDEAGKPTYLVQAGASRVPALTNGFPSSVEALFAYDALIVGNIEGDFFTRAQLEQIAAFVSRRGGGLLVFGGRSFAQRGLIGTALEEVLPLELDDRRSGLAQTSVNVDREAEAYTPVLTPEGEMHVVMRVGATPAETRQKWAALPALGGSAPLGGPRPGASILAVTASPSGTVHPLVAVQRYGRGRSMVFAGEASWRWRMLMPSDDRTYEFFWRQAVRWLAGPAPGPVTITAPDAPEPEDAIDITVETRNRTFEPVGDAVVEATLTAAGADPEPLALRREAGGSGRARAAFRAGRAGLYHVHVTAREGSSSLGTADRWFYVGGSDREFADPRMNEGFLRRAAEATGGRYVRAADASEVGPWLEAAVARIEPEMRDLWHNPWTFAILVLILSAEWILRRRWGLR